MDTFLFHRFNNSLTGIRNRISSVNQHPILITLVDCEPTSPTPCALLRKQSTVASAHLTKTNGTMRDAARHLQSKRQI